jgi:hypothetical protein
MEIMYLGSEEISRFQQEVEEKRRAGKGAESRTLQMMTGVF